MTPLLDRLGSLPEPDGPLLADGAAGLALVNAVLAQADVSMADRSREHLERAVELLAEVEVGAGLWTGIAGVGWVLERLRGPDEDPCAPIDEVLVELVRAWPDEEPLDWMAGVAGIAAYAHARLPAGRPLLEACVGVLAARAEPLGAGVGWCATPAWLALGDRGRIDLGLAHGQPGVLAALGLAVEAGISGAEALLDAGLKGTLPLLPEVGPVPSWADGPERGTSPHAWCYGAAGVGAALARLGGRLGRRDLELRGRRLAGAALAEPPRAQPPGGLCHAHASALMLARALGDPTEGAWRARVEAEAPAPTPDLVNGRAGQLLALAPGIELWRDLFAI